MSYNLTAQDLALASIYTFGAMQKPEELIPLIDLVTFKAPKVIMELGFGKGGTAWAWSKIPSLEHLILIDLPQGPFGGSESKEIEAKLQFIGNSTPAKVTYIAGNSANSECVEKVKEALQGKYVDFLYIDADHTYAGVKTDFLTYSPFVNRPGLIGFHDIAYHAPESGCEVDKFWKEVLESGIPPEDFTEFIHLTEPSWGGNGAIRW